MERVHFCNHPPGSHPAVPVALQQTVAFTILRMAVSICLVIIGMELVPVSPAVTLIGFVIGIAQESFLLPLPLPGSLAFLFTAVALILDPRIGCELLSTMGASDRVHGCPPRQDNHIPLHRG